MNLSISTYSLARWRRENKKSLEQSLDWITTTGVRAVEFAGLDEQAATNPLRRAASLKKRCEKLGLAIVSYCVPAELLALPTEQRKAIEQLKLHVDVAAELDTTWLRHDVTRGPATSQRRPTLEEVIRAVTPPIVEVTEYAQTLGIRTSVENHGTYMQGSQTVEKLLLAVNHPNFGLTLDMGNFMVVGENPVDAVRRLAKYSGMVHVKDFHKHRFATAPEGWFATTKPGLFLRGAIVGHGEIDIPAQFKILKRARYQGYVSLEFEGIEEPTMAIGLGLDYLRKL